MRGIWDSKHIPLSLKLRIYKKLWIYKTGVCSRLVYGCEGWKLDARTCSMLNGANSRMMARITKRTVHEETSSATRSFDVVANIRARRHQWVGHILRLEPDRMIHQALFYMHMNRSEGDLLMDTPRHLTWDELVKLASGDAGRIRWRQRV